MDYDQAKVDKFYRKPASFKIVNNTHEKTMEIESVYLPQFALRLNNVIKYHHYEALLDK